MKDSIRRVFSLTGIIGLLAFSVVTINQVSQVCENGQVNCLSAAVTFGVMQNSIQPSTVVDMNHAAPTTIATSNNVPSMVSFIFTLVQVTSVYLILLSVLALVALEIVELRYLRRILGLKTV
jgi:hypothetical protein